MKIFESRKGYIQHPIFLFLAGILIGLALVYLWINYTTVWNPYCIK